MTKPHLNATAAQRLKSFKARIDQDYSTFIGFPAALDFDYTELAPFLQSFLNNVGDPYSPSWHGFQSKAFEQEVIDFFARLFRAPQDGYWGYITNGSTECNLYALYAARRRHPEAVAYYSAAAHYSIPKNIDLLALPGEQVRVQPTGEMDYTHLRELLGRHPGRPAVVVATIGTTMTEARDNLTDIQRALSAARTPGHYIHADAALAGPYAALLEPRHPFDFHDGADSISISGHKFIGSPTPSGVIIIKQPAGLHPESLRNYTGSTDTTISGSRNGHTPLFLWYAIQRWGTTGLRRRALAGLHLADYAHRRLQDLGWQAWRNPGALTVMLASPPTPLITKWQLATDNGWSHIICMPGVTQAKIDAFIADLATVKAKSTPEPV